MMGMVGIFKGAPFLANKIAGIDLGELGTLFSGGLIGLIGLGVGIRAVSYTHLDVYKRQGSARGYPF